MSKDVRPTKTKPVKREPTLFDRFLHSPVEDGQTLVDFKINEQIKQKIRAARRFRLTTEAAHHVGSVISSIPELLFREQQFARAPYDLTWIEFPYDHWFHGLANNEQLRGTATEMGFLVDHGNVYTVAYARDMPRNRPAVIPFVYTLHKPWEMAEQLAFAQRVGTSRLQLDGFLWGATLEQMVQAHVADNPPDPTVDGVKEYTAKVADFFRDHPSRSLRNNHTVAFLPFSQHIQRKIERMNELNERLLGAAAGDLRNIVALLLLMNRPSLTRYVKDEPHWKTFVNGKSRTYMSHTVVTIDFDPRPALMKIGTALGKTESKRRHEVRGVYCHDEKYRKGTAAGCIHDWYEHPDYLDDISHLHIDEHGSVQWDNWLCKGCAGHRWWRETHERGDASKGYVVKEYEVR